MVAVLMREPRPGSAAKKQDLLRPGATITVCGLTPEAGASLAAVRWTNPPAAEAKSRLKTIDPGTVEILALQELPFTKDGVGAARELDVEAAHAAIAAALPLPPTTDAPVYLYTKDTTGGGAQLDEAALERLQHNHEKLQEAVQGLEVTGSGSVAANMLSRSLGINSKTRRTSVALDTARSVFPQSADRLKTVKVDIGLANAMLVVAHVLGASVAKAESGAGGVGGGVGASSASPAAQAAGSPGGQEQQLLTPAARTKRKRKQKEVGGGSAGRDAAQAAAAAQVAAQARAAPASVAAPAPSPLAAYPYLFPGMTASQQPAQQLLQQQAQQAPLYAGMWGQLAGPSSALQTPAAAAAGGAAAGTDPLPALQYGLSGALPVEVSQGQQRMHAQGLLGEQQALAQQQQHAQQQAGPGGFNMHQAYLMALQQAHYQSIMMHIAAGGGGLPGGGAGGAGGVGGGISCASSLAGMPEAGGSTTASPTAAALPGNVAAAGAGLSQALQAQQAQYEPQQAQQVQYDVQPAEAAAPFDVEQFLGGMPGGSSEGASACPPLPPANAPPAAPSQAPPPAALAGAAAPAEARPAKL